MYRERERCTQTNRNAIRRNGSEAHFFPALWSCGRAGLKHHDKYNNNNNDNTNYIITNRNNYHNK